MSRLKYVREWESKDLTFYCNNPPLSGFKEPKNQHINIHTVELQWLEHHWDHGNLFETWVVRATEGLLWRKVRKQTVIN